MKWNRRGVTREVFIFKSFVIKIPSYRYSWQHFLCGLLANIKEGQCWRYNKFNIEIQHLLCPVIWTSWGGWILIMKKADVEGFCDYVRSLPETDNPNDIYKKWFDVGLQGDDKADNYGYYNNKIVKIDYGK